MVFLAIPGANVFTKDGALFTIGERKVRGVASQGMICAQDELGLGHDHSGIIVLPEDTPAGISAADYYDMPSDVVFEIGLTPNRADATSHIGVAKDILAWIRVHEDPKAGLRDLSYLTKGSENMPAGAAVFPAVIENSEACPLYSGLVIEGIRISESPEWLKNRLLAAGQRPINNVVDITNYVRLELGQPLHAFDLDKIGGGKIIVKTVSEGKSFVTLDGVERKLFADDLMICDGHGEPMCIGGVFGGADSGVSETTTRIFLEAAIFNAKWIRRTMIRHSLRTDSAWVFEKGADPGNTGLALTRAALLIESLAGGKISSGITRICPKEPERAVVKATYAGIGRLIGEDLGNSRIGSILDALDILRTDETATAFTAHIPTGKPDVTREADLVEEILRVYGLDNITIPGQIRSSMEVNVHPAPEYIRNLAAEFLASSGFNECMSLSLGNSAHYTGDNALWPVGSEQLVFIHNSANQGLDCLRPTMLLSALDVVAHNQNRQNPDLRLFEFGKVYRRSGETGMEETARLSLTVTGARDAESWHPSARKKRRFLHPQSVRGQPARPFGYQGLSGEHITGESVSVRAEISQRAPGDSYFWRRGAGDSEKNGHQKSGTFCRFQRHKPDKGCVRQQDTVSGVKQIPDRKARSGAGARQARYLRGNQTAGHQNSSKALKEVNLFDVFDDENKLGAGKKSCAVSFIFEDTGKTLQDKEIDAVMNQLTSVFEGKLGAVIRK